jgi:ornithine cyclodeaminase/alanine dehydrogenase-like protein (mu-crystallin family)
VAAIMAARKITRLYILDKNKSMAEQFSKKIISEFNIECSVPESSEVLREVDIICTATTADQPVFSDGSISSGTHINAIGSFQPTVREIPSETVQRARIFADQKAAVLMEAGDIRIPIDRGMITEKHIIAELGEIATGKKVGRMSDEDITLFKSVGNAVQDLYAANLVYEKAIRADLGQKLEF